MSVCNDYYWFSPNNWICNAAGSVTKGLGSGAFEGVERQVEHSIERMAEGIGKAAQAAFATLGEKMSQTDSSVLGKKVAEAVKNFMTSFEANSGLSGESAGNRFGEELSKAFNGFWDKVNLSENTIRLTNEFNKAFTDGIKNAKLEENINLAAQEIGKGMHAFRTAGVKEVDAFRNDIQGIFANMARDTTLKMVPWVALGGAILVGTPLLLSYLYYKAKHNIGRPKLAAEVRYVGWYNRAYDAMSNTVSGIWNSVKPGISYAAATALSGAALAIPTAIAGELMSIENNPATGLYADIGCHMGFYTSSRISHGYYRNDYNCRDSFLAGLLGISLAVGAAKTLYTGGTLAYQTAKKWYKNKEPKPIFNAELQKVTGDITKATYNLQKNGGYFQNVLLYGPGGTGKTMISQFIARNSNMNYVMMSGGDLAQYIKRGEHVTELNKLFEEMENSSTPTILFIDEAESLCRDRDKLDKAELIELLNAFLKRTGEQSKKIMLILATNRLKDLDPAVLSRMDHKLFIGPPKAEEREAIIKQYAAVFFSKKELNELFSDKAVKEISEQTEGLTGRALFKMLNAMEGCKNATANNTLTKEIVDDVVRRFMAQERKVLEECQSNALPKVRQANPTRFRKIDPSAAG